jgi:YVTN family beta-propeller protein
MWSDTSAAGAVCMVGTHSGKYLYFHSWHDYRIGVVDLDRPDPTTVASIPLHGPAFDLVISPDDRFIYAVHEVDDFISVIDTSVWPPTVRKVPVVNSPYGLELSADGKRLFVAQSGIEDHPASYGTGSLTVLDTATMQCGWLYTGKTSVDVVINAAETRAYVSNFDDNTVSVVDVTGSPVVTDTITGFSAAPGKMCFSADEKRMYVAQYRDPSAGPPPGIAVVAV